MHNYISYKRECYRKLIHISSIIIPILLSYFGKATFLPWIIGLSIILPLLDYYRRYNIYLNRLYLNLFEYVTRPIEYNSLSGASWVFIGSSVTAILFEVNIATISLFILCLSDSFAAIIGMRYGKTNFFSKSFEGTSAFFIMTSIILIYMTSLNIFYILIISFFIAIIELFSNSYINDNLTIPLFSGILLTILI